jgi:hypothetical protein
VTGAEAGIRALYAQAVAGTAAPRWRYFDRDGVGALLAEIDRLRADAPALGPQPGLSCWACRKPIEGPVVYQGGSLAHPAHPGCLFVIGGDPA